MSKEVEVNKYTLTHEDAGTKIEVSFHGFQIGEVVNQMAAFLRAVGFSEANIREYIDYD